MYFLLTYPFFIIMFTNYTNFGLLKSSLPALTVAGAAGRDRKLIKLVGIGGDNSGNTGDGQKRGNR